MKRASLFTAAAIVMVANVFALAHAWKNRMGPLQADIVLTERELTLGYVQSKDDSGVTLNLQWMDPSPSQFGSEHPASWLDQKTLQDLGFDTSVSPSDDKASEFYRRQRARRVYVALEFDGPAWRSHVEQSDRENNEHVTPSRQIARHVHDAETHLVAVDVATDAAQLRARHPDRKFIIIVPAVVRITVFPAFAEKPGVPARPAYLTGFVQEVATSIHVPRPFSDAFQRLPEDRTKVKYRVHLLYGSSLEPWVVGTEFPPTNP